MNENDYKKLLKIRTLLKEAYDNYFTKSDDGHCKSEEGLISLEFGNYWTDKNCELKVTGLSIYSYVLGSSRSHYFDSIDTALDTVVQWHRNEINRDYEGEKLAEQKYWDEYHKKHPEDKVVLINPEYKE